MINRLSLSDTRPGVLIDKINEVVDAVNNITKDTESLANSTSVLDSSSNPPEVPAGANDPRD